MERGKQDVLQLVPTYSPSLATLGQKGNSNNSSVPQAFCQLPCAEVKLLGCLVEVSESCGSSVAGEVGWPRALEQFIALLRNQPVHPLIITET